jgi:hypothetical protein
MKYAVKWVFLTKSDNSKAWVNIERFDIMYESVDEDGRPCTAIVMIIGEDEYNEFYVLEKPEEIWDMLEKKSEKTDKR